MCRLAAQRYNLAFQEPMPVEQLVQAVCDTKQVRQLDCVQELLPFLEWPVLTLACAHLQAYINLYVHIMR
jgi:hypothetical protein